MTSILNEFEICAKVPQNVKINIKTFYVFKNCFFSENIIFVTNKDKVYGLGHNYCGTLGLGHNRKVNKIVKIKELSNQRINQFYSGWTHVLGRNDENELFSWGWNIWGQLGTGFASKVSESLRPQKIDFFKHETIEDICCGGYHTIVLLSNGLLYGWGRNSEGQLCLHNDKSIDRPTRLEINEKTNLKFKSVYCCDWSSFALTTNGLLFSWGHNKNGILGQGVNDETCIPKQIELFNVEKLCLNRNNSYFLTNDGFVYFCGEYKLNDKTLIQNTPKKMIIKYNNSYKNKTIHDLHSICGYNDQVYCSNSGKTFWRLCNNQFESVDKCYDSVIELFAKCLKISLGTIHISNDGTIEKQNIFNGLQRLSIIGCGGFGSVGKFLDFSAKKCFAIKMIDISNSQNILDNSNIKEVETMITLKSHFVVQYIDSWIENNNLFIQMEYCFDNLRNILAIKPIVFERTDNQMMNSIEFFISCQIFLQITEALNYLHSLKPEPLIHRDLKPENILIGKHENRLILKLADFGLSKFTDNHSDYHTMIGATHRYRAPEIASGHRYDTSVDIWSLGIIGLEVFDLENQLNCSSNNVFSQLFKESLDKKLEKCDRLITLKLLTPKRLLRMTAKDLLVHMNGWCLTRSSIHGSSEFKVYFDKFAKTNLNYFHDLMINKPIFYKSISQSE